MKLYESWWMSVYITVLYPVDVIIMDITDFPKQTIGNIPRLAGPINNWW